MKTETQWRVALSFSITAHVALFATCIGIVRNSVGYATKSSAAPVSNAVLHTVPYRPSLRFTAKRVPDLHSAPAKPQATAAKVAGGGAPKARNLASSLSASVPAALLSLSTLNAIPDAEALSAAPVIAPMTESTPELKVASNPSSVPLIDQSMQSAEPAKGTVSTAQAAGLSAGSPFGETQTESGASSGLGGASGNALAGTGDAGNGVGEGSGIGGDGNGTGTGTGNGAGPGASTGSGGVRGGDRYASGGTGLPYGLGNGTGSELPKRTVYLIDISPSMSSKIKAAVKEVTSVMNRLTSGDMFNVVLFGEAPTAFKPTLTAVTPEAMDGVAGFLATPVEKNGGTNLEAALRAALRLPEVKDIVVVTDGMPTKGEYGPHHLARLIKRENIYHARIYTVGFMDSLLDNTDDISAATILLQMLAQENGGATRILDVAKW